MVILGAMGELGEGSAALHREVLGHITCEAWLVGKEWPEDAQARRFASVEEVTDALKVTPVENKTVLVKGSHSTKLYQLPQYL